MKLTRGLFTLILLLYVQSALAYDWQQWFYTQNQRAQKALDAGQTEKAAELFTEPNWQGVANYRTKHYDNAIKDFGQQNNATADYNRGNALARKGDFAEAIDAYKMALSKQSDFADAKFNKELLEKLQKEQKKQQKKEQQQQPKQQPKQDNSPKPNKPDDKPTPKNQEKQSDKDKKAKQKKDTKESITQKKHKQRFERALNGIPDDPGGILRQKFLRDHIRNQQEHS